MQLSSQALTLQQRYVQLEELAGRLVGTAADAAGDESAAAPTVEAEGPATQGSPCRCNVVGAETAAAASDLMRVAAEQAAQVATLHASIDSARDQVCRVARSHQPVGVATLDP